MHAGKLSYTDNIDLNFGVKQLLVKTRLPYENESVIRMLTGHCKITTLMKHLMDDLEVVEFQQSKNSRN